MKGKGTSTSGTSFQQVDNLSDREEEKLARMDVRFARVREYLV